MDNVENVMNDNKNKLYGSSILDIDERLIDNENNIFNDMKNEYTEDDLNDMREELKNSSSDIKTKDRVFTDSISGIKSSEKITNDSKNISEIVDSKDSAGKEISSAGIDLIYNLLDTKPTEEELTILNKYFSTIYSTDDIYCADINVLKNILGSRISNKIIDLAQKNNVSEYEAITKFIIQLYSSYMSVVQFNDDINELYDLVTNITQTLDTTNADDVDMDSILNQYKILNDATNKIKDLDERNSKLKNDYKVTDFDTLIIDSVKKCLEEAISFKRVYNRVDNSSKKIKKDMKDISDVKKSIENWINDLKSDTETLYVFPVNDYLTSIESVNGMINYISGFIMLQDQHEVYDKIVEDPDNPITDVTEYFINNGYVTKSDLKSYDAAAILFLYILSRVFKKKKIKTNDDRRILSYTLDIISKASKIEYASIIMEVINYCSTNILKLKAFKYIK